MLNKYLFFSLIFIPNILACELVAPKEIVVNSHDLQLFCDHMKSVDPIINIATNTLEAASFIKSQITPNEEEIDTQELCEYKMMNL